MYAKDKGMGCVRGGCLTLLVIFLLIPTFGHLVADTAGNALSLRPLNQFVVAILFTVNAVLYVLFLRYVLFRAPGRLGECIGNIAWIPFKKGAGGLRSLHREGVRDGFLLIVSSSLPMTLALIERLLITKLME